MRGGVVVERHGRAPVPPPPLSSAPAPAPLPSLLLSPSLPVAVQPLVLRLVQLGLPLLLQRLRPRLGGGRRRGRRAEETPAAGEEYAVEEAVDDEVAGRVDGQQGVGELPDPLGQVAGGLGVAQPQHRGHDGVRRDEDEEGQQDDHQHQRDAMAGRVLAVGPRLPQRADDAGVDDGQDDQGDDGAQEVLRPVEDEDEGVAAPQLRQLHLQHHLQCVGARAAHCPVPEDRTMRTKE